MMGVPLSGPSFIYGDNMLVIHNTQQPESVLKKKSNSICYHAVQELVAMDESQTDHVGTYNNLGDLGTKVHRAGAKCKHLVGLVMYSNTILQTFQTRNQMNLRRNGNNLLDPSRFDEAFGWFRGFPCAGLHKIH
jgi:benzoyl-CoA reductase/2-hydroxyglutaryl-CoA dehydratase subunit BcrC/BadD/HgdB